MSNKIKSILVTLFKLFLAGIITLIGGYVTCGGNMQIPNILGIKSGDYLPDYLWLFWIVEILIILIWSLYFLFWSHKTQVRNIFIILSGVLLIFGIISAFYAYGK